MDKNKLAHAREQIDALDAHIVHLLGERAAVAEQVGKAKGGKNIYQPTREAQVIANALAANRSPLPNESLTHIYTEIIAACRNLQQPLRVAFLGPEGTYCQEAALALHGQSSIFLPQKTIAATIRAAENGDADIAVVPIENSTEGSVHATQDALVASHLTICNEITLPIHHQLLSNASSLTSITEVIAHPQALAQCQNWLAKHVPHAAQTAATSNGAAAQKAASAPNTAAIAGKNAAAIYNISILAHNIEDIAANSTRFVTLGAQATQPTGNDTTMIICSLPNKAGSLHELLGSFAKNSINMTKLESRPTRTAQWEYTFYIQIDGHQADPSVASALQDAQTTAKIKVVGSYPKADYAG